MQFRKFGKMELAVSEPPHSSFPNTVLGGGQSTVYRASRHRKYAELFLAYMASEDYNMQIARDGDALPPNPAYTQNEEFLHPPDYPNEWGCHESYLNAAQTIAVIQSFSPFVLPVTAERYDHIAQDEVMNHRMTPEEAGKSAARRINEEIQLTLRENLGLKARYEKLVRIQEDIDGYKSAGKRIPLSWIHNPFHRSHYKRQGMLAPDSEEPSP